VKAAKPTKKPVAARAPNPRKANRADGA
jgi:hypothetical protein